MDISERDNLSCPSMEFFNCYKVVSLTETIIETVRVSNLKDRYILGEQLGWGQFGVIRVCSDKLTGERLACKSISKERLVTEDDLRSVKLEIGIMSKLSGHPDVVDLKAVYEEEDYVHIVMDLCAGGELFQQLKKYGKFSEIRARVIFRHLMQVVKFCHDNGIVHRDLKPENVLLATTSSFSPIKLADFGLATYIKSGEKLSGTVGSPFYIAPEVLAGEYNQAVDVWSAGVILYILLSGVPPFWGKTKSMIFDAVRAADLRFPSDLWDHISASATSLIKGMLCIDPSKRLSAEEVLAHSWMDQYAETTQESYDETSFFSHERVASGRDSFSSKFVARDQDCSFSNDQFEQSQVSDCRSSFSAFLAGESSPRSEFGGFCFGHAVECTIPSMPSFTFFSPTCAVEHESSIASLLKTEKKSEGSTIIVQGEVGESEQRFKSRREPVRSRTSSIHSRRTRTIGLGELDQLIAASTTESMIRWASCTHIPTAPSLRLSLVC